MKAVVTGGAGFIGSHLVEELVQRNYEVTVIDNLVSGKVKNLNSVIESIEFCQLDIRSSMIDEVFKGVDVVFHLAALADIIPSITAPYEYIDNNVMGTVRVLEAARKNKVKKVIFAASSSCYGLPLNFPTSETEPTNPQYPYALSKYLAEQIFLHWKFVYKTEGVSLRLFNVYGPRARTSGNYGAVLGVFLGQKRAGLPLTIVGDGNQTRDFTYVSDVVKAFTLAHESPLTHEILNIGTSKPTSINRLAELLGEKSIHIPKRPGEPDITHADIGRAREELGWVPEISIEEGVSLVLKDIDSWADAPAWTASQIEGSTIEWFRYLGSTDKSNHDH